MIVAIDGPAGSGKSTVAHAIARRLGLTYLDTGAMYRTVCLRCLQRGVDLEDADAMAKGADDLVRIRFLQLIVGDIYADKVMDIFLFLKFRHFRHRADQIRYARLHRLSVFQNFILPEQILRREDQIR